MITSIQQAAAHFNAWLAAIPDPVLAVVIFAVAVTLAVAVHRLIVALVGRALSGRFPYTLSLLAQTSGVTRLALIIFALSLAVQAAPFDPATIRVVSQLLVIALVILVGWAALTAVNLAADLYLFRYKVDTADNLLARKHVTQVRVLQRVADTMVILFTVGAALMTFESVRQYGVSLFASAGVAGIVAGLAARPVLSNIFAGIQLAVTQPIRIDDAVIVENEFGNIEEITSTYVVVKLWDLRRMVVPLTYFIEKPFQNWTRDGADLIGVVMLYLDFTAPVEAIRAKAKEIVESSSLWNRKVFAVQVTDFREQMMELRILASANYAGATFDLRCEVREKLIDFLQREHPDALPRQRQVVTGWRNATTAAASALTQ